jgi:hypothetical protein
MNTFADAAETYLSYGLPCFPVGPDKTPLVSYWQKAGKPATRQWAKKFPDANVGICCGKKTHITEVDVDVPGDNAIADAIARFGDTPVVIRTASGKAKLWYRHNGEGRLIRPIAGLEVDVLGGGYTVAPPSRLPDTGRAYRFIEGGLDDLDRLPMIDANALPVKAPANATEGGARKAGAIQPGHRNDALFRFLMRQVPHCDDLDALLDIAHSFNGDQFAEALPEAEVITVARSAWGYEQRDSNYCTTPRVTKTHDDVRALMDVPEAAVLLDVLRMNHGHKGKDEPFCIVAKAMAGTTLPTWGVKSIRKARDALVNRNYVRCIHQGRAKGDPSLYVWP